MKRKTPKQELTSKEKKDLLLTPNWTCEQVMKYTGYAKSKSFQVMQECKTKLNGAVIFEKHKVKRNSVLAYMGTSLEEEMMIIKKLEKQEET